MNLFLYNLALYKCSSFIHNNKFNLFGPIEPDVLCRTAKVAHHVVDAVGALSTGVQQGVHAVKD